MKPLISTDPKKTVVEIPEVLKIIGDAKVCWGCASSTCLKRQILSRRLAKKKFVNKFCMTRKLLLGDKILLTSLETKVEKNKQSVAFNPSKKKGAQKKTKEKLNNFSAAIVKKPSTEEERPKEPIKRVNRSYTRSV